MKDGGRLSAAIEVLTEITTRYRPVGPALYDWGKNNRYAGSSDRAWITGLVLDVLRRRRSLGYRMESESHRDACLAALRFVWEWPAEDIARACAEQPHGPGPLTKDEAAGLVSPHDVGNAPPAVRGDYPDWLDKPLARAFGDRRAEQMAAMTERAPLDLRVNLLKSSIEEAEERLKSLGVERVEGVDTALRIPAPKADLRVPPVEAHPAYLRGFVEVQDAGSQIAATLATDIRGLQVLDLCAGGGGKTLAMGAAMDGLGVIYAYDIDARRMRDLIPRAERAGIRNLDVRTPLDDEPLKDLNGKMDLVFVDAPCTGTGTWRRHPDAKWRLTDVQLKKRMDEQDEVLKRAATFVKPGGRIVYVTCSFLMEENEDRVAAFLKANPNYEQIGDVLRLTPLDNGTDGFFGAVLRRN